MIQMIKKSISLSLALIMLLSCFACSDANTNVTSTNPNEQILTENIYTETILNENTLNQFLSEEVYLNEIVIVEDRITGLLLEESMVNEVLLCKVIYVPQDHIDEFAINSQISTLFDGNLDISNVLLKVALGTGVIVTLVILSKVGLDKPVASVVCAAADESLQFASNGAAIGTLFGGLTGAADNIDTSGRTSAIIAFSAATAGLILSIVSLVSLVHSGGSSTITATLGAKLVVAGVSVLASSAGTVYSGINAIKTFTSTDSAEIDWDNIDWDKLGVESAQKAIGYGADGYMWGAIVGAVHGGVDGYDFYHKFNTPYSTKSARLQQTPKNDEYGHWTGKRGESDYIYDKSKPIKISEDRYVTVEAGTKVTYQNAVPDFSPFQEAQVKIPKMTGNRKSNFDQADEALAEQWTRVRHNNKTWTASEIKKYRTSNGFTWHEMNNMESMQLVPTEVNAGFGHLGGVGEYNAMIGAEGVADYD